MKQFFFVTFALLIAVSANAKVVSQPMQYDHNGTVLEGYLSYDVDVKGMRPGVLVVHEWWGCNDYARRRADMLADTLAEARGGGQASAASNSAASSAGMRLPVRNQVCAETCAMPSRSTVHCRAKPSTKTCSSCLSLFF